MITEILINVIPSRLILEQTAHHLHSPLKLNQGPSAPFLHAPTNENGRVNFHFSSFQYSSGQCSVFRPFQYQDIISTEFCTLIFKYKVAFTIVPYCRTQLLSTFSSLQNIMRQIVFFFCVYFKLKTS